MKARLLFIFFPVIGFSSCNKSYQYIEVVNTIDLFGHHKQDEKEPVQIKAANDSIAYFKAFQKYTISEKVNRDMVESLGSSSGNPVEFKLLNKEGKDIASSASFQGMQASQEKIRNRIFSQSYLLERKNEVKPNK